MPLRLLLLFVVGACLGAIVNLGIYRLAYDRRRISPWSRTRGKVPARTAVDRIPIVGWWYQRRLSDFFGAKFWVRPMLLELCFGLATAALYWMEIESLAWNVRADWIGIRPEGAAFAATLHWQFAIHIGLLMLMTLATFIDIDEQTIPDSLTIPGTIAALLIAAFCTAPVLPILFVKSPPTAVDLVAPLRFDFPDFAGNFLQSATSLIVALAIYLGWCFGLLPRRWRLGVGIWKSWRVMWRRITARPEWRWVLPLAVIGCIGIAISWHWGGEHWRGLVSALVGMAVGGGLIWVIRLIASAALQQEAMGFGDVTLMAMIGAFFGWQAVLIAFFAAPFVGCIVGLVQWLIVGNNVIAFGPYLCLGALAVLLFWSPIWDYAEGMFEIHWLVPSAIVICLPVLAIMLFGWRRLRDRLSTNAH
jgi:leader peptidase (prepilin peptidase) / N-methyltransferase